MYVAVSVAVVPALTVSGARSALPEPSAEFATVTVCDGVVASVVIVPPEVDLLFSVNVYEPALAALGATAFAYVIVTVSPALSAEPRVTSIVCPERETVPVELVT